jgi:hypothetical protein
MEVFQGPNWGCSAKEKKCLRTKLSLTSAAMAIVTTVGPGNHNIFFEHTLDTQKVSVLCGLPHYFVAKTISGDIYLDLLEQFAFLQVDDIERENATGAVFQRDGCSPQFSLQNCLALNTRFQNRWIRGGGLQEVPI